MKVTALANWFGSARMVADVIGPELAGLSMVVVPFMGGASELPHIEAGKIIANDKHRHVINLARVIADPVLSLVLYRRLRRQVFHPDTLAAAQERCRAREYRHQHTADLFNAGEPVTSAPDVDWAEDYFVATWMGRGGNSGTKGEFGGSLPIRYCPNGGGSGQRFHNAASGVPAWRSVLRRCEFTTEDAFDVLAKVKDIAKVGIYCDPPWPDAGDGYANRFSTEDQHNLAAMLVSFSAARVVVRFGDHPLIRKLYPESRWTWKTYPNRQQHNGEFNEVLIVRNGRAA